MDEESLYVCVYAYNVAVLISGKIIATVNEFAQCSLNLIEKWCRGNELSVNPEKTDVIHFTSKRRITGSKSLTVFGK